jgi:hypothetical protein
VKRSKNVVSGWKLGSAGKALRVDGLHKLPIHRLGWALGAVLFGGLGLVHLAQKGITSSSVGAPIAALLAAVVALRARTTIHLDRAGIRGAAKIPGRIVELPWASVENAMEQPDANSDAYVWIVVTGAKKTISVLVERLCAPELIERIRLRKLAAALSVDDAATMLELYFDPKRKPVAVVWHEGRWTAYDQLDTLLAGVGRGPYRDGSRLTAFADPDVMSIVESRSPGLVVDLVEVPSALAPRAA